MDMYYCLECGEAYEDSEDASDCCKVKQVKLSETAGFLHVIAKSMINMKGEYKCILKGEKVKIINE